MRYPMQLGDLSYRQLPSDCSQYLSTQILSISFSHFFTLFHPYTDFICYVIYSVNRDRGVILMYKMFDFLDNPACKDIHEDL